MQTQSKFVSFRIPEETYAALDAIKVRDGIPLSEQMRRALLLWLEQRNQSDRITRRIRASKAVRR